VYECLDCGLAVSVLVVAPGREEGRPERCPGCGGGRTVPIHDVPLPAQEVTDPLEELGRRSAWWDVRVPARLLAWRLRVRMR
jgi:DNA-directed RNA polymerase subunit RPC12/RpoP